MPAAALFAVLIFVPPENIRSALNIICVENKKCVTKILRRWSLVVGEYRSLRLPVPAGGADGSRLRKRRSSSVSRPPEDLYANDDAGGEGEKVLY